MDAYNEQLSAEDQIDTEEAIAFMIAESGEPSEEACALLGKEILKLVLKKFRPDLMEV